MRFEFEIRQEAPQIVGRLLPVAVGAIVLDQMDNQQTVALDELGSFEFGLVPGKPFRLRFVPPDGHSVATEWVV